MSPNRIIINADDFGYDPAVNKAIVQSFERGLITSTSLMANMPGFDNAIGLVRSLPFLQRRVGIHFNLTEGFPLSASIRRQARFCDPLSGEFICDRQKSLFFLNAAEQKAVYEELTAQLERILEAGIQPSHLDSHHHIHTEWAIARLVARLGQERGIRRMRLTRNMGRRIRGPKMLYKKVLNHWYLKGYAGITAADYFGDIHDWNFLRQTRLPSGKNIEIMVHPLFTERGELVDYDQQNLQEQLAPVVNQRNTISYSDL